MSTVNCGFPDRPDLLASRGPTLSVQIGFDPQYRPGSPNPPDLPPQLLDALVDTGAIESCIDSAIADELGLPIFDQRNVSGALGPGLVNMHLAQIYIPDLNITVSGRFAGVHLSAGGQRHGALIGRSFLRQFQMMYDGPTGNVTLAI
jgi:predicted aspartyl protease